jgi:energy-coupling factor transporter ATP-binding protein EcfA2
MIREMQIVELFGRYTYTIRPQTQGSRHILLLYGDNGSGKTTILNLLWHLLSPADHRGHRTAVAKTPFRSFAITLSNGDTITATKLGALVGTVEITVAGRKAVICREVYPLDSRGNIRKGRTRHRVEERVIFDDDADSAPVTIQSDLPDVEPDSYLQYLHTINFEPYFLADDRRIYSDHFAPGDNEGGYTYIQTPEGQIVREARHGLADELAGAIRRTNGWLSQQVLSGTAQGSQGVDAIYLEVLSKLVGTPNAVGDLSIESVKHRIVELDRETSRFSEFGLVPHIDARPYLRLLDTAPATRLQVIEEVFVPYLDGQRARLTSLSPIEFLIRTFVETVNEFFTDKRMNYTFRGGIKIRTNDGGNELDPEQLSSGERQLLVLLCNSLLARSEGALFIIDEPEISLNAKWQRKLIPALLACVQSSGVQFVLATHSVEIISGHRQFLAQLRNRSPREER